MGVGRLCNIFVALTLLMLLMGISVPRVSALPYDRSSLLPIRDPCWGRRDGDTVADRRTCGGFFLCMDRRSHQRQCDDKFRFDPYLHGCVSDYYCDSGPRPVAGVCNSLHYLTSYREPGVYYQRVPGGDYLPRPCAAGLVFDTAVCVCNYPAGAENFHQENTYSKGNPTDKSSSTKRGYSDKRQLEGSYSDNTATSYTERQHNTGEQTYETSQQNYGRNPDENSHLNYAPTSYETNLPAYKSNSHENSDPAYGPYESGHNGYGPMPHEGRYRNHRPTSYDNSYQDYGQNTYESDRQNFQERLNSHRRDYGDYGFETYERNNNYNDPYPMSKGYYDAKPHHTGDSARMEPGSEYGSYIQEPTYKRSDFAVKAHKGGFSYMKRYGRKNGGKKASGKKSKEKKNSRK